MCLDNMSFPLSSESSRLVGTWVDNVTDRLRLNLRNERTKVRCPEVAAVKRHPQSFYGSSVLNKPEPRFLTLLRNFHVFLADEVVRFHLGGFIICLSFLDERE